MHGSFFPDVLQHVGFGTPNLFEGILFVVVVVLGVSLVFADASIQFIVIVIHKCCFKDKAKAPFGNLLSYSYATSRIHGNGGTVRRRCLLDKGPQVRQTFPKQGH